jgi:hypothetical protein
VIPVLPFQPGLLAKRTNEGLVTTNLPRGVTKKIFGSRGPLASTVPRELRQIPEISNLFRERHTTTVFRHAERSKVGEIKGVRNRSDSVPDTLKLNRNSFLPRFFGSRSFPDLFSLCGRDHLKHLDSGNAICSHGNKANRSACGVMKRDAVAGVIGNTNADADTIMFVPKRHFWIAVRIDAHHQRRNV